MDKFNRVKRELIHNGSIIDMYADYVEIPNGNTAKWDFIGHKGAAAVVPVTDKGTILMVKQYRNAIDRVTLEIPAGGKNGIDEPTKICASRELEEETGYRSEDIDFLISIIPAVAYSNEKIDIYVAHNLIKSHQNLDEDEYIDVYEYSVDELVSMIIKGQIEDSKTISAILAYKSKYIDKLS